MFTCLPVPKDGSCFYHAAIMSSEKTNIQLGVLDKVSILRATTAAWMRANPDDVVDFVEDRARTLRDVAVSDYRGVDISEAWGRVLDGVTKTDYAEAASIHACARVLNVDVVVYSFDQGTRDLLKMRQSFRQCGCQPSLGTVHMLLDWEEKHFNVLLPLALVSNLLCPCSCIGVQMCSFS